MGKINMKKLIILIALAAGSTAHALDTELYNIDPKFGAPIKFNVLEADEYSNKSDRGAHIYNLIDESELRRTYYYPSKIKATGKIEQYSYHLYNDFDDLGAGRVIEHNNVKCGSFDDTTSSALVFDGFGVFHNFVLTWVGARDYDDSPCEFVGHYAQPPMTLLQLISLNTKAVDGFFELSKEKEKDIYSIRKLNDFQSLRFNPHKNEFSNHINLLEYQRHVSPKGIVTYSLVSRVNICGGAKHYFARVDFDQEGKFIGMNEGDNINDTAMTKLCK